MTRAAFADFDAGGVRLRMECNYASRPDMLGLGTPHAAPQEDHAQTMMGCGAEGTARERRYFRFFDRSPSIEALGPQRLLLRAGDQTLVLERPETRRRAFVPTPRALTGTWRLESIARYEQGSAVATAGLSAMPGTWSFPITRSGTPRAPRSVCGIGSAMQAASSPPARCRATSLRAALLFTRSPSIPDNRAPRLCSPRFTCRL